MKDLLRFPYLPKSHENGARKHRLDFCFLFGIIDLTLFDHNRQKEKTDRSYQCSRQKLGHKTFAHKKNLVVFIPLLKQRRKNQIGATPGLYLKLQNSKSNPFPISDN